MSFLIKHRYRLIYLLVASLIIGLNWNNFHLLNWRFQALLLLIVLGVFLITLPTKVFRYIWRYKYQFLTLSIIVGLIIFVLPLIIIKNHSKDKIYSLEKVPPAKVAIVYGAAVLPSGEPSLVLADRIQTAVWLYEHDKVAKILMSGGNPTHNYNEPEAMKNYAIKLGVDPEDISVDFAGYRTFDTCARAEFYNITEAILVSQRSHLPRAIYLCEKFDIQSSGVAADLREYRGWNAQLARETVAKIFAFWEVNLFRHQPQFLADGSEEGF
jgi:SanA protein